MKLTSIELQKLFASNIRKFSFVLVVCVLFVISACSAVQNLKMTDVMIPENKYVSGVIKANLNSIDKAVEWFGYHCSPPNALTLNFDGENRNSARAVISSIGWTQSNPTSIITFEEIDEFSTSYITYAYNSLGDRKHIDEYLLNLNLALKKQCP